MCNEPQRTKMVSVYWAWTWPTGDRRAYKQHLCVEDAAELATYVRNSRLDYQLCFRCNEPLREDSTRVTVWITAYFPKHDRIDAYADFHVSCHNEVVPYLVQGAERLDDRGSGWGAPRPDLEADPWQALGLTPAS
jgi:hypothetical protein